MAAPHGPDEEESVWWIRDFRLVLAGGFANDIGDWLLVVAVTPTDTTSNTGPTAGPPPSTT